MDSQLKSPFCHLHWHGDKSRLDGYGTEESMAARCAELGHFAAAVTDHGNVCSHVRHNKAFRKLGLKSIPGCEFYICDDMTERSAENLTLGANAFPHVTVLASTGEGYENLLRLSRLSFVEGAYRYPRIDWATLARYQKGLVVLSGCPLGYPTRLIENKGEEACHAFLLERSIQIERFFVEIIPSPDYDVSCRTVAPLIRIAQSLGLPLVVTGDAHFPRPEDHKYEDAMLAIGTGCRVNDPNRKMKLSPIYYACDVKTIYQRSMACIPEDERADLVLAVKQAIVNTSVIADSCEVELPKAKAVAFPKTPKRMNASQLLWVEVCEGLKTRQAQGILPYDRMPEYMDRCRREFDTLEEKGFCDYILIVADIIRFAKAEGALVLTRGSAGGCCLLWALGASVTDPILHDLSFERFFDASRSDPPDVDIDFPEAMRPKVFDYIRALYGAENVAQLGAFQTYQAKAAVKDIARVYGIPADVLHPVSAALSGADNDVAGQLDRLTDPKALAVLAKYPVLRIADKLVGQMRNTGMHACGVVVSNEALDGRIGVMKGSEGQLVTAWDKRDVKDLGYLKMDLLSVKGLDVMQRVLELLGKTPDWLETLPLDDPKALEIGRKGLMAGIFQLDGSAALRVAREIVLDTFPDFAVASALCRPGPAEWVPQYAQNKQSTAALSRTLGAMPEIAAETLKVTYGILVYQEQVMRLANEMAGLPMERVQVLRKGVSDKLGTQPDKAKAEAWKAEWRTLFVDGCAAKGVSKQDAEDWWHRIEAHGGYSFNKSHCYTYAFLGYWMAYCKAHFSGEFYSAYLEQEEDIETRKKLIREFRTLEGEVRVLDPQLSSARTYAVRPDLIVGGFSNLYKCGEKTAEKIQGKGPFLGWEALLTACSPGLRNRIVDSGLVSGQIDHQRLLSLAPWYPVGDLDRIAKAARAKSRWPTIGSLPEGRPFEEGGETCLMGYVTARDVSLKHVSILLEDETGTVAVRVSQKNLAKLGAAVRELQIADLVAVSGWWSGDTLYIKGNPVLLRKGERSGRH